MFVLIILKKLRTLIIFYQKFDKWVLAEIEEVLVMPLVDKCGGFSLLIFINSCLSIYIIVGFSSHLIVFGHGKSYSVVDCDYHFEIITLNK